jgi:hypothetical protein
MINTKLQNIIDTKSAIGNAIVNKGGTITSETPFFNYAAQIDGISTGTPQTIFQASDGSKWALTNAVNLTNVSNNVTSDFNYWQPANNSTSDPILNVGTVGANISGNIQLVPVNQVNIAQFQNIVATDINGGKYVGFNGFDFVTNPTPTGNTTFNRWLLNNSASGTVLFANAIFTTGTYNGPNSVVNEANMAFINNTASYGAIIHSVVTNNGFIYTGGRGTTSANRDIKKYSESNLSFIGNSVNYGGFIQALAINNGFIYAGGATNLTVQKFHESNLAFVGNTSVYGSSSINTISINNGFLYVGGRDEFSGDGNASVKKYHESNLAFVNNTVNYGGEIKSISINDGYLYVAGGTQSRVNLGVSKYHESNLAFVNNTAIYNGQMFAVAVNNGFIYAGGGTNATIQRFYENNLVFVDNSISYGAQIENITISNGFVYVGGYDLTFSNASIQKFNESTLNFVGNTVNLNGQILGHTVNNGFIYASAVGPNRVDKYQEAGLSLETLTFYTATKIKE